MNKVKDTIKQIIKKNFYILAISLLLLVGCNSKQIDDNKYSNDKDNTSNEVIDKVKIIIDEKEYILNLEDNETTKAFINLLPRELHMNELNGNEKYVYLDISLPTNSKNPKHINAGDVMLYGDNCLVIFYKSFDTKYSYTEIGHIDNLKDLGNGNITVRIEK